MTAMLSPKIRQSRRARSKSMVMGEVSQSPGRLCATIPLQERALKAGWLKKQRSIMKNWQLRWFVLRSDHLYFYKDEEETKPQGNIPLQGSQVNELSANTDEHGRHLFEIVPGGGGERDKAPVSHEAVLLMANTQSEVDDWVKAIRRVIWAPFGGGIFGQRLEETVRCEGGTGRRLAPQVVEQCVDFIRQRGLREEGLFRMPGQANLVKELQDAFDCGDKPLFDSNTDVHTVASLLKLYLRELPEPVVPFAQYEDFLTCAQLLAKDEEEGIQELEKQVRTLPQANYNLLKYICRFLHEVQSHSHENKMSVQNLATVFGPNILRPKMEDPVTIMEGTSQVQHLMTALISGHERLYMERERPTPGPLRAPVPEVCIQGPRGMAGWISEEDLQSGGSSQRGGAPDGLGGSVSSLDTDLGKGTEEDNCPGKRARSLPAWRCTLRGPGTKLGGSSGDVSSLTGGNWLSSLRGHRRTSSGEPARDSSPSHRLSTYDNVTISSLSVPSTSWSTSSCDISVPDSGGDSLAVNGGKGTWLGTGSRRVGGAGEDTCISSGGCNSGDGSAPGESAEAMGVLVEELREELRKQKLTYETRIKKMEDLSTTLRSQVERLEQEMDVERRKQRMLEIKLRNSERARKDAEERNRLLEQEMESFFSSLGGIGPPSQSSDI